MSWQKLLFDINRKGPFIWLAGDVHYSYVQDARIKVGQMDYRLVHAVSSGFRHEFSAEDRKSLEASAQDPASTNVGSFKGIDVLLPVGYLTPFLAAVTTAANNVGLLLLKPGRSDAVFTWLGVEGPDGVRELGRRAVTGLRTK